jgi:hypothetical protein
LGQELYATSALSKLSSGEQLLTVTDVAKGGMLVSTRPACPDRLQDCIRFWNPEGMPGMLPVMLPDSCPDARSCVTAEMALH